MKNIGTNLFFVCLLLTVNMITPAKADVTNVVSSSYGDSSSQKTTKGVKKVKRYNRDPITAFVDDVGKFVSSILGPRPGAWCGWWMRSQKGGGPEYNVARNWAHRGTNAGGPKVGAVVVWPHHVGIITGKASNGQWVVKSGNDSNAVRERPRSVAGAIAFRIL